MALLDATLGLKAIPRNPTKPERFANYGLSEADDRRLSEWMRGNLQLAVWPTDGLRPLVDVEIEVLAVLQPPLNLKEVTTPWSRMVSTVRARKAEQPRAWAQKRSFKVWVASPERRTLQLIG